MNTAQTSLSAVAATTGAAIEPKPRTRRLRAQVVFPVLLVGAVGAATLAYARGMGKESTDDAFVESHVSNVAARVPGQALRVLVKDNEVVDEGAVLVELDDRDAKVRVRTADADLASAKASLVAAEKQLAFVRRSVEAGLLQAEGGLTQASATSAAATAAIDQSHADLEAAESRRDLAQLDFARASSLVGQRAISQAEADTKKAVLDQAIAGVNQAKARLTSSQTGISNAAGTVVVARGRLVGAKTGPEQIDTADAQVGVAHARVDQAEAALAQAQLNLSYMTIRAPFRGEVARRTVEPGQMVAPERPLLSIVSLDDVWVVANFKEDQLAAMHAGETAQVRIDTYGRKERTAHVESVAGGSGSRFALLPPDNASGNFTKVVQRIPVLVRFDDPDPAHPLRAGMSADVTVITREPRP
jgi:membrane fusion protein (multidrug efflux system)